MNGPSPALLQETLDLACKIQQIPGATFHEQERASLMLHLFQQEGLQTHQDAAGNVYGCLPGPGKQPVVVSAHMDTVHPLDAVLSLARVPGFIIGPGIGDNSLGLACLIALPRMLKEAGQSLPGALWLAATTCEEGLGNLAGARALVDFFGDRPLAYLVVEGIGLGQVLHRALAVERYRVTFRTAGGHSWVDFGSPSAIHALADFITRLRSIPLSARPRTTYNVGVIQGGTTINTIAPSATAELDLRSEDPQKLRDLIQAVRELAAQASHSGVYTLIESIGARPSGSIPEKHPLVRLVRSILQEENIQPACDIASTDASVPLSRGYPAVCVGMVSGGHVHTENEFINTDTLDKGLRQLYQLVTRVWDAR